MFIINKYKSLRASSETRKNLSVLKQPALSLINDHLIAYPTPSNLNYFWGFGSLAGISLIVQIATGVFLACHYTPEVSLAFSSVERISEQCTTNSQANFYHVRFLTAAVRGSTVTDISARMHDMSYSLQSSYITSHTSQPRP